MESFFEVKCLDPKLKPGAKIQALQELNNVDVLEILRKKFTKCMDQDLIVDSEFPINGLDFYEIFEQVVIEGIKKVKASSLNR